jgi:NADH dehydrogenase [ubiquinone] 1 alpha subcomplex assembly factor 2
LASASAQKKREGSVSNNVPAPGRPVDPGRHDDPAELRRLAEEDTKRRIQERGGEADLRAGGGSGKVEGVDVGQGAGAGGLAPRRRGKK